MPLGNSVSWSNSNFFYHPPKNHGLYNSTQFKQEFLDYMLLKQQEYDSGKWFSQLISRYKEKLAFQTELFRIIEEYDCVKYECGNEKESKRVALLTLIEIGVNQFNSIQVSNLSCMLRKWYYRLEYTGNMELQNMRANTPLEQSEYNLLSQATF